MLPGRVGMWWSGDIPFKSQEISSLELFHAVTPDERWRYLGYFEPSRDVRRAWHWINVFTFPIHCPAHISVLYKASSCEWPDPAGYRKVLCLGSFARVVRTRTLHARVQNNTFQTTLIVQLMIPEQDISAFDAQCMYWSTACSRFPWCCTRGKS